MTTWKFYSINDLNQETMGNIKAFNIGEAYVIASKVKKLPLKSFKELFKIKKFK